MSRWNRRSFCFAVCGLIVGCVAWGVVSTTRAAKPQARADALAAMLLDSIESRSGLCVHLGVEDGALATTLSQKGRYLVHGLATKVAAVDRAREQIAKAGLSGVVSVEIGSLKRLPYADRLVNLIVADNLPRLLSQGLQLDEVFRVLRPGGVAWLGQREGDATAALSANQLQSLLDKRGIKNFEIVRQNGVWAKIVKPRPAAMDRWTHKRHDATGNPVSKDRLAGVPSGVRWVAGPNWPTGYRKSAVPGVVASQERLVYIFQDEVQTANGPKPQDTLMARDAFNGLLLWKRRTTKNSTALVSVGDRVYTVLEDNGPLVALDANTGKLIRSYKDVIRPSRVLYVDGLLLVDLPDALACLEAANGELKWKHSPKPAKFVAGDGRVFFHDNQSRKGGDSRFGCLDLKTGEPLWTASTKAWSKAAPELVLYQAGLLVAGSKEGTHGISAKNGAHLWTHSYPLIGHGGKSTKVMYSNHLLWVHAAGFEGKKQYAWEGLNPRTGAVEKRIVQPTSFAMKHRCNYDVATERYFMCGSMDFADLETGDYSHFGAARNSCAAAGLVPANGLLYTFPHACGCFPMLRGFLGLATTNPPAHGTDASKTDRRLRTGPAYGQVIEAKASSEQDWPMYRHDARRSGSTTATGPSKLQKLWDRRAADPVAKSLAAEWDMKDGGRLSSPVVANGLAFVAAADNHRVAAFDEKTGQPRWSFTAGGRVDCPPAIHDGLCLFGSRDGWVYCLRAEDGVLVWRFRAAPEERRIVAYGQLESPWPVVGGVLVLDELAYFVCGRHAGSDGGVFVSAVNYKTGELVWTSNPEGYEGVPDVLNAQGNVVQMAAWGFDAKTGKRANPAESGLRGGRLGLLNDAWYKRPIALRKNLQLWSAAGGKRGQMLAFNQATTSGFIACSKVDGGRGTLSGNAELFTRMQSFEKKSAGWTIKLPTETRLRGMVLTPERLYVAGRFVDGDSTSNVVRTYAITDGKLLNEYRVDGSLIHDCLAVAKDRLYVSTQSGTLICLGAK